MRVGSGLPEDVGTVREQLPHSGVRESFQKKRNGCWAGKPNRYLLHQDLRGRAGRGLWIPEERDLGATGMSVT